MGRKKDKGNRGSRKNRPSRHMTESHKAGGAKCPEFSGVKPYDKTCNQRRKDNGCSCTRIASKKKE